jgi:FixJ family two-component response regulator
MQQSALVVAVVDDDASVLRSLEYLLDSADYQVHLFSSAEALLSSALLEELDCVVSDIDMPGTDGFELLRRLHAVRPGLPTILITGYPETSKRMPAASARVVRFFSKPFDGRELLAALAEATRRS